jgi:hypothetical protein
VSEGVGGWFVGFGTHVEARDDTVEVCCAIGVGRPHAAQPGAVVGYESLEGRVSHAMHLGLSSGFVGDVH